MMDYSCVNDTLKEMGKTVSVSSLYEIGYDAMKVNFSSCNLALKLPSDEYWKYAHFY